MSKTGVNSTPMKQDQNPFKKDNRGPSSSNMKDEKRSSDSFTSPRGQGGHSRGSGPQNRNQNDNRHYDNSGQNKHDVKDEKSSDQQTAQSGEKKFTGRCRLFVGNLTPDVTESDFRKMFEPYGEVSEVYVNTSRGFGFIRLDYRQNAEAAKAALDGLQRKGRILRVRFATHGAALKVKNLHPYVSNELLEQSFSQFGELERCIVIVDDRGKATGEGIVEFVRKPGANSALRRIKDGVFLMGADPKPVAVEPLEQKDEEDGMPEKFLTKTDQYKKEREKEPRFAPPGTFEYEFGMRWKQLEELERQRIEQIKKDTEEARLKLEDEMQNALYEYQAEQIRQDLIRQQEELRRLEELRNQDRMRRQQELEMRRQQDDRERAQQEERRRADMMMSIRQQEIARGRPLDAPGMRGREEMMMADRYGDRMGDRMPDRMSDRPGDRLPERMGDRMGPGQPGFMWDEKQRGESSPKPLMQGSGFGGMGGPQGGGAGPNNPPTTDAGNPMDEDRANNSSDNQHLEDADERSPPEASPVSSMARSQLCEGYKSSSLSEQTCEDSVTSDTPMASLPKTPPRCEGSTLQMDQLWETDTDYRICNGHNKRTDGKPLALNSMQPQLPHSSSSSDESAAQNTSDNGLGLHDVDYRLKPFDTTSKLTIPQQMAGDSPSLPTPRCRSEERCRSAFYPHSEEECVAHRTSEYIRAKSVDSFSGGSSDLSHTDKPLINAQVGKGEQAINSFTADKSIYKTSSSKDCLSDQEKDCFPSASCHRELDSTIETADVAYESLANNSSEKKESNESERLPIQRYMSSESNVMDDSYQSTSDHHTEDSYMSSKATSSSVPSAASSQSNQSSDHAQTSKAVASYKSTAISDQDISANSAQCLIEESKYTTSSTKLLKNNLSFEHNAAVEEYKSTDLDDEYQQPVDNVCEQLPPEASESCYQQSKTEKSCELPYKTPDSAKHVSSYKQHAGDDVEDMDAETLEEEDAARGTVSPSIYQSYEEDIMAAHYHTAALASMVGNTSMVEHYNSADQTEGWGRASGGDEAVTTTSAQLSCPGSYSSSSTYTSTQNTLTVAATQSARGQGDTSTTSTSSSPPPPASSRTHGSTVAETEEDHGGALCTGDQTFRSAAARQSALVPFMKPAPSRTFVSTINPTLYAGQSMVQGMRCPSVMTSSSVHIAQHPGGATIMRQQSMSTGLNGGMAQATVMQQQAMHNGVQATAVVQQRTLTNGGQTMLVQQRTMTTGLGAMSQQTVVQQRVAAPSSIAQAAALHANALRQRAMASQPGVIPHRAVRMLQTHVVGNPVMRAQALRGPTLIQHISSGSSTALLGPGLVRGASQGSVMQQLVRQRYLGGPVMPGRGIQMMAGRPIRVKMTYPRETLPVDSNT